MTPTHIKLWDFSLTLYRHPQVEQTCLALQDQWDANVNIMLWLCWLEVRNIYVDAQQLEVACEQIRMWDQEVTVPLRKLRRQIKIQFPLERKLTESTRNYIKDAELAAEKVELESLSQIAIHWSAAEQAQPPGNNLLRYLSRLKVPQDIVAQSIAIFFSD